MRPAPLESVAMEEPHGDSIVISGVSTLMPGCKSFLDLAEKLYIKERLVKHNLAHWNYHKHPELSPYVGVLTEDLTHFDAQFFMVHNSLAPSLSVVSKKVSEQAYKAVFDAGVCPAEMYGKPVAVYAGVGYDEYDKPVFYTMVKNGLLGASETMIANRVSYYMNLTGPSVTIDADSCSAFTMLELAQQAILSGVCDSAIVSSAKILRHSPTSIAYHRHVPASPDGKMRSYDSEANGQVMSEAVTVMYLQKYKDAKRVYAHLRHVKSEFTMGDVIGEDCTFHRDVATLTKFFSSFYDEAKIPPSLVEYIDGFGAAIPDFDKTELEALAQVFCKTREYPLTVGSIASNVGYTEVSAGFCGIVKMLIAYQRGEVPANLDCDSPRRDVAAIQQGLMQITTEHTPFRRTFSGVSSYSLRGLNGHALLQGVYKPKKCHKNDVDLPYLLLASGRRNSAVQRILEDVGSRPIDPEEIALFHNIFKTRIPQHMSRGYGIYESKPDGTKIARESKGYYDEKVRPLWFVYSGMGSQWAGMGVDLMRIPVFADAIFRCHKVLEQKGLDLVSIITNPDQSIFDYILNSFVGIAAIQIGLTDVLKHVGLVPDNIIGHSVGELGCAYADGCLTAEETILMSYYRGLVSVETKFIRGSMAAVGIGYKQISRICPSEIEVACRNGPDSCTISGPERAVSQFVQSLKSRGIFAKEVKCSNIAYHSRYIAEAGPTLLKYTKEVVKTAKPRSKRWISTSVPQNKWNTPTCMYSSAEYHTNNLLNPVLFEDVLRFVPSDAVLVEVAPHGLLQAILRRSLSADCQHVTMTRRDDKNAVNVLVAIGKLYMAGYDVDPSGLYPKVEFPVATETRPLSHLVELIHDVNWPVTLYKNPQRKHNAVYRQVITVHDDDYSFLTGHSIEGRVVYPFAAALTSVWDTLSMITNSRRGEVSVVFQDVMLRIQPVVEKERPLHVSVTLQRGCGRFEVTCDQGIIADGTITAMTVPFTASEKQIQHKKGPYELTAEVIYKLFYDRGHEYSGQFQSISNTNLDQTRGQLKWNTNWVTFIDAMLQMQTLRSTYDGITQIDCIKSIAINFKKHLQESVNCNGLLDVTFDELASTIKCGGVVMESVRLKEIPSSTTHSVSLRTLTFVPFKQEDDCDVTTMMYVYAQIIAENLNSKKITVFCINSKHCALEKIKELLKTPPLIDIEIIYIDKEELFGTKKIARKPDLVYMDDLWNKSIFEALFHTLPRNTYILSRGIDTYDLYPSTLYRVLCSSGKGNTKVELARWRPTQPVTTTTVLTVKSSSDINNLMSVRNNSTNNQKLLILTSYPAAVELKKLVTERKTDMDNISVVMMPDNCEDHDFKPLSNFDFVFNIYRKGVWGGEYCVPTISKTIETENVALIIMNPGDLDSLTWVQVSNDSSNNIPVTIHYVGLNVNDVYRAQNSSNVDDGFGMDFSGLTERGDRVMGLVKSGAARRTVRADPRLLWPVPDQWSLEDAATVPLAYAHAFYCLAIRGKLRSGMTILIHGGAGALGQAAISIALAYGCLVFTTVSDVRKKHFLRKLFPELKEENIGNSRDETFGDMIITRTKNEGCDIVVSCVRGSLKNTTLKCVASGGMAIDIAQLSRPEVCNYNLFHMFRNRSFSLVDFSSIFRNDNNDDMLKLHQLISDGIALGHVRPLSRVTYSPSEVPRALRLLAASRHRGRVLVKMEGLPRVEPRIICSPNLCQLIVSEREDFAVQLADRLVARGARKIHLHYIRPTSYLKYKQLCWRNQGVQVQVTTFEMNKRKQVEALLKESSLQGGIEDIFIMIGGVPEYLRSDGSMLVNLDLESRRLCPNLRNFTIISDEEIDRDIVDNRTQGGLPVLVLLLQNLKQFGSVQQSQDQENMGRWRLALDAIEKALQSGDTIVYAHTQPSPALLFMEEINRISGITVTKGCEKKTLEQLGVDGMKAFELCNMLRNKFGITVQEEHLPEMTLAELKNLQNEMVTVNGEEIGFSGFLDMVDKDELISTSDRIEMPTLIFPNGTRPDELNKDLNYICVVPGLEGHYSRFYLLCERLKMPAVVLQPGIDHPGENIEDMAKRLVDVIRKKLTVKDHYYLVGYEFGALMVLEMATILEKLCITSTVYLLGGTPTDIQCSLQSRLANFDANWEDTLALHSSSLIKGTKIYVDLQKAETWDEKVDVCVKKIRKTVNQSSQYIKMQINAFYNRINMLRNWNFKIKPLNSKVIILRAMLPTEINQNELKRISTMDVDVFNLSSSLTRAAKDLKCSAIVNRNLSPDILEEYRLSNKCETSITKSNVYAVVAS
ncbi:fatty acid synthase-like [Plodia interpunctella]|uniref:fatty acid synthase-like n=1 Tax=Plodia interpunctella TaxID=58824 RepID=UPI002367BDEA|nr:fatty acid synthase-like [Plodia interpunctella]